MQINYNYNYNIINPVNTELNPICHLLALLEAHHILHVSRIRGKVNNPRRMRPLLDMIFKQQHPINVI